jgi:hypothetical protein
MNNKNSHIPYPTIIIVLIFLFSTNSSAWDNEVTHKDLSKIAAEKSTLGVQDYLKNIGFSKGLDEKINRKETFLWVRDGAFFEDKPMSRSFNHFHNPLKQWGLAGLNDTVLFVPLTGESSLLWSQDGSYQQNSVDEDWSWQRTREYYYLALISKTDSERQANFAKTFMGLGHQMHLLQDTAVPDHVRNDAHPEDAISGKNILNGSAYFETWAKEKFPTLNDLKAFAPNPDFPNLPFNIFYDNLVPITQFFDAEQYNGTNPSVSLTQGLAEYTNANFFSGDTIFAAERYATDHRHYFPYPKESSTDLQAFLAGTKPAETVTAKDGIQDTGIWISKGADGENIKYFVKTSKLTRTIYNVFGEGELFYKSFYRDEKCHEDYAALLIPRTVGYSAELLNYFFRGEMEFSKEIYEQVTDHGFTGLYLKVKNLTPNEEMKDGEVLVSYKYKPIGETEFTYRLSNPVASGNIPYEGEAFYDFTFPNPIPADATDVQYLWVFNGTLGQEVGAVVGKVTPDPCRITGEWLCKQDEGVSMILTQVGNNITGSWTDLLVYCSPANNYVSCIATGTGTFNPSTRNIDLTFNTDMDCCCPQIVYEAVLLSCDCMAGKLRSVCNPTTDSTFTRKGSDALCFP